MGYGDRTLVGVGGWLAFFCIVMGILTPIRVVVATAALYADPNIAYAFGERWAIIQGVEWALSIGTIAGAWYLVWRLMKVEVWQTVRIVIAGIWILGLAVPALEMLLASWLGGFSIAAVAAETGVELIRGLIFAVIWTAYFLRSERVANTYARGDDPDDPQQVFG
jgi:hypothetical protein